MHPFHIIGILTGVAAIFGFVNYHVLRLQTTVALMLQSLILSAGLMLLLGFGIDTMMPVRHLLNTIDFNELLLEGILSFLIFAGALFVKNDELLDVKFHIALLATAGVVISTGVIGATLSLCSGWLGLGLPPLHCFLFGALISPTDPVAVLPTLRTHGISPRLNAQIAGEALFNDGIGIVVFLSLMAMTGSRGTGLSEMMMLFARQAVGGIIFGIIVGWLGYRLIKSIDDYQLEILITLALVSGGYSLATVLHISGPLAMVMAGLLIGGPGRRLAMSEKTRKNLDRFWEMVEELLNAVLFTLIGLEVLTILHGVDTSYLLTAAIAVPVVLLARLVAVAVIAFLLNCFSGFNYRDVSVMTWSGLRGGIPIALALALPGGHERGMLLFATYVVVAFSILVQGGTLKFVVDWRQRKQAS